MDKLIEIGQHQLIAMAEIKGALSKDWVVSLSVRDKFAADVQLKYPGNPRKGIFRRLQHGLFDLLLSE